MAVVPFVVGFLRCKSGFSKEKHFMVTLMPILYHLLQLCYKTVLFLPTTVEVTQHLFLTHVDYYLLQVYEHKVCCCSSSLRLRVLLTAIYNYSSEHSSDKDLGRQQGTDLHEHCHSAFELNGQVHLYCSFSQKNSGLVVPKCNLVFLAYSNEVLLYNYSRHGHNE